MKKFLDGECKRCLLHEAIDEEYHGVINGYIQNIDSLIKTPEEEYSKRVEKCRNCDYLINGMCRLCGCFVELRAAKHNIHCADTPEKW